MKNVLWLASWYPDKLQPFTGDFIERHARAASLYNKITVLYIVKDHLNVTPGKYFVDIRKYNENCSAHILYYMPFSRFRIIESLFAGIRYFIFLAELIRQHIHDEGKPDMVHVHVSWRAGLLALYCRWRYKLHYVISEHWSIFLPSSKPGFRNKSFVERLLIKWIFRKAERCSAVSEQLANALKSKFKTREIRVIPNVVDTKLFKPSEKQNAVFRFIHISDFNYPKNPEQLFEAIALLKNKSGESFECLLFAPDEKYANDLAAKYGISDVIKFRNYVPQALLSIELGNSDALVMYSRFETFGCVVIESLAAGVPVIVSDIPVMHEIIKEDMLGVFAPLNNPEALAEKMLWIMNNCQQFDGSALSAFAHNHYSFERVGGLFNEFYHG